jgi:murein L,D-transpeptidase YafK
VKRKYFLSIVFLLCMLLGIYFFDRGLWVPVTQKFLVKKTTDEVVQLYGKRARDEIIPYFEKAKISYPPKRVTLLAMKEEKVLEVWASNKKNYTFVRSYNIQKLSGKEGPKLREGDRQVPEGRYKIIGLNPNSSYHLSMKLNYPNEFDLLHAKNEGRTNPGTNIFIHGKSVSIGCIAMGDKTIEELFVLSKDVGIGNVEVVISPYDPRAKKLEYNEKTKPKWISELYRKIEKTCELYKKI